ncbi:MAG: glycosyltransferase family 2 protein [Rhizobiales bacterium]|nr:glycosyltransferase family 2 protein [Rhizobacter sp.]
MKSVGAPIATPETHPQAAAVGSASPNVDVTALIVNYNTAHLLERSIGLLRASEGDLSLQISIVDNASRDDSVRLIRERFVDCDFIANATNVGFGRANNQMLAGAAGRYVLLLNTDAFVEPRTLRSTVEFMDQHPECGVLGVRLEGRDHSLQPSCRYFPTPWNSFLARTGLDRVFTSTRMMDDMSWDHASIRECDWVPGCYYLVRRVVIDEVGLFDPRYFLYFEEVDHCRAVKAAGWKVVYFPDTTVVHIGGESAKSDAQLTSGRQISELQVESELLYFRKHHGRIGVAVHIGLTLLADLIVGAKDLVRNRRRGSWASRWQSCLTWLTLLRRTGWGQRATR